MVTLKEIREKSKKKYTSFHRMMLHTVSTPLTWIFLRLPFTPKQITVGWGILQLLASLLLLNGNYWYILVGVLMFHLGTFLDCVDGQIARFRGIQSVMGNYLDQLMHYITIPFFFICFTIGVYVQYDNVNYLYWGLLGVLSFWNSRILSVNPLWFPMDERSKVSDQFQTFVTRKKFEFIYDSLKIEYPLNLFFFGVLFNLSNYVLIIYSIMFFIDFIKRISSQYMKMMALDRK